MRKLLVSIALLFGLWLHSNGQSITPDILNAAGGSFKVSNQFMTDWNIGEMTLVNTMQPPGKGLYILTNGLLQPEKKKGGDDDDDDGDDDDGHDDDDGDDDDGDDDDGQHHKAVPGFTASEIKVFPNPAIQFVDLNLSMSQPGTARLELYNTLGQQLWVKELSLNSFARNERIPLAGYRPGTYLLFVHWTPDQGNGYKTGSFKIVKTD